MPGGSKEEGDGVGPSAVKVGGEGGMPFAVKVAPDELPDGNVVFAVELEPTRVKSGMACIVGYP